MSQVGPRLPSFGYALPDNQEPQAHHHLPPGVLLYNGAAFTKAPEAVVAQARQAAAALPLHPTGKQQVVLVEKYAYGGVEYPGFMLSRDARNPAIFHTTFGAPDGEVAMTTVEQDDAGNFAIKQGKVDKPQLRVDAKALNAAPEIVITCAKEDGSIDTEVEPSYLVLLQAKGQKQIVKSAAGGVEPQDLRPGEEDLGNALKADLAVKRGGSRELSQEALGNRDAMEVLGGFKGASCTVTTNVVVGADGRVTRAGRKEKNEDCLLTAMTRFHVSIEGGPGRKAAYVEYLKEQLRMESAKTGQPLVVSQSELDALAAQGAKIWAAAPYVYKDMVAEQRKALADKASRVAEAAAL